MASIRRTLLRVNDAAAAARLASLEALLGTMTGDESAVQAVAERQAQLEAMTAGLSQQLQAATQQGQALAEQSASAESMLTDLAHQNGVVTAKVTTLAELAGNLTTAQTSADSVHDGLQRGIDDVNRALDALAKATGDAMAELVRSLPAPALLRRASGALPAIATVLTSASADVALTWDAPFPENRTIAVLPPFVVLGGATLLGKVGARVKSSSRTGCMVTVTSTAVLSASAGTVDVLAYSA